MLLSFTSLLICLAMLVGSTFAWFTDTATTGVNKIVSGTLDVDIVDMQGETLQGKTMKWQAKDGRDQEKIFWEPGCTYYLEPFMIQNKGNLALKYKIELNGFSGDKKLLEALEFGFYYFSPGFGEARTLGELMDGDKLDNVAEYPGLCSAPIYIFAHMKEEANNDYQELSIDDLSIVVYATQDTYEKDSKDDQYDKDAPFPIPVDATVTSAEDIKAAMEKGKAAGAPVKVTLSQDVSGVDLNGGNVTVDVADKKLTLENNVISEGGVTINGNAESKLGNAKVTVEGAGKLTMGIGLTGANGYQWGSFTVKDGGTLNVTGGTNVNVGSEGKLITATGENTTVNISGGTFESSGSQFKSVEAQNGAVVNVTGGTFSSSGAKSVVFYANGGTVIISDCKVWVNGNIFQTENDGQIVVTGGTFSQNPSAYVDLDSYNVIRSGSDYTVTAK